MKNTIVKSISILFVGTLLTKMLGFFRELVVSYKFGAGEITDAFVLTNSIPNVLFNAIVVAIGINFIPVYVGLPDKKSRNAFSSNLITYICCILLVGCIIMLLFPKFFVFLFASGINEETRQYAIIMLRIVAFSCFPIILSGVFQAYTQAEEHFFYSSFYGVIINVVLIIITYFSSVNQFYLLSIGVVIANTFGCLFLFIGALKSGFHYRVMFKIDNGVKEIIILTVPLLIENIASNLSGVVDKNMASFLNEGTISALGYAEMISSIAYSVIATAIITATFTRNSKLVIEKKWDLFVLNFEKYANVMLYILIPISVFMCFYAETIVIILFERGAFDSNATQIVSEGLVCYSIGVAFCGLKTYLVRAFYSLKDTKTPVFVMVFSLLLNICGNFAMVGMFKHKGIALSTSLSYIVAVELLLILLKKKKIEIVKSVNFELIRTIIASILSGITSWVVWIWGSKCFSYIFVLCVCVGAYVVCFIFIQSIMSRKFRLIEKEIYITYIKNRRDDKNAI